jgi:Cu/Ag efflux pump CusA
MQTFHACSRTPTPEISLVPLRVAVPLAEKHCSNQKTVLYSFFWRLYRRLSLLCLAFNNVLFWGFCCVIYTLMICIAKLRFVFFLLMI